MNRREKLLMAAVTGIAMGLSAPATEAADEKKGDVKCFGINGCGSSAKCGAMAKVLNWQPASAEKCKAGGGYVVEEKDGKKVARKV